MPKKRSFRGDNFWDERIKKTMGWFRRQGVFRELARYELRMHHVPEGAVLTPHQMAYFAFGRVVYEVYEKRFHKEIDREGKGKIREILKAYADYFSDTKRRVLFFKNVSKFVEKELEYLEREKQSLKSSKLSKEAVQKKLEAIAKLQSVLLELSRSAERFKVFLERSSK